MTNILETCAGLDEVDVPAGTVLLNEGSTTGRLHVLIEGEVRVLRGDIEIARAAEPGSVFGEMSILLEEPHSATVRAAVDSRMFIVENADDFLARHPDALRHVSRILAARLRLASGYLADLKRQFSDSGDHLGMVEEVLDSLLNDPEAGKAREFKDVPGDGPDPRL